MHCLHGRSPTALAAAAAVAASATVPHVHLLGPVIVWTNTYKKGADTQAHWLVILCLKWVVCKARLKALKGSKRSSKGMCIHFHRKFRPEN